MDLLKILYNQENKVLLYRNEAKKHKAEGRARTLS